MGNTRVENNEISAEMEEILSKFKENTVKIDNSQQEEEQQKGKEKKHFDIINKIQKINNDFNEIDEYFENLSSYQSQNDEYISDLLHYMEQHEFTQASALKFINLLKEKRKKRRELKCDWEIKNVFNNGRSRFSNYNQRELFMASLYKKERELSNPYKPRQITFEEIDNIITVKKRKKTKEQEELNEI